MPSLVPVARVAPRLGRGSKRGSGPEPAGDRLTFVGTATTLLRLSGFTLLTDPNFLHRGQHVHLRSVNRRLPTITTARPAGGVQVVHRGQTVQLARQPHGAGASRRPAGED